MNELKPIDEQQELLCKIVMDKCDIEWSMDMIIAMVVTLAITVAMGYKMACGAIAALSLVVLMAMVRKHNRVAIAKTELDALRESKGER